MADQQKSYPQVAEEAIDVSASSDIKERGVSLWMLVGPSLVILTVLVGLVKADPSLIWMPAVAVLGMGACWRWKMSGLFAVLGIIICCVLVSYQSIPLTDRFWHVGMAIAVAVGMVVTTLCSEEVESLFRRTQVESRSRLENLWSLDEKGKQARAAWQKEKEDLSGQLRLAVQEVSDKEKRLSGYEQVMSLVRKDLDISQRRQNELLEEVFRYQQEVNKLRLAIGDEAPLKITAPDRLEELNEVRVKLFQSHLDYDALEERADYLRAQARETRKYEGLYNQLREQFNEKREALSAAQQELLSLYDRVAAFEESTQEGSTMPLCDVEKLLEGQMASGDTSKDEVKVLEDLVSSLMEQVAILSKK